MPAQMMRSNTLANPCPVGDLSITTALADTTDHTYRPPAIPSEQDSLPLTVATEVMYDGLPQRMDHVSVSKSAEWPEVRACLGRSREGGWQLRMPEEEQAEREEEAVPNEGNSGDKGWLYQEVVKGVPGKDFLSLKTPKQWRKLRAKMIKEDVGVVVWPAVLHAEMLRRKAWLKEAEAEDLVDFHNACEMDVSLSLGDVPVADGTAGACEKTCAV